MPLFTLHRNHVLRTTTGHAIEFRKGQPTHVPQLLINAAISIGAVPVEGMDAVSPEEPVQIVLTPDQRKAKLFAAFDTMAARDDRADYTASGMPNAKRLPALTGFEVTLSERDTAWTEFRAIAQANKDQHELDAQLDKVG